MASKTHKTKKPGNPVLYRSETNKVLGGVCGGLGEVFGIDATIVRVVFALAALFGGSGLLFYLVLWLVIPSESRLTNSTDENIRQNLDEMKERAQAFGKEFQDKPNNSKKVVGIVVIVLGLLLLLDNFGFSYLFNFGRLWPVLIIVIGLLMITRRDRKA